MSFESGHDLLYMIQNTPVRVLQDAIQNFKEGQIIYRARCFGDCKQSSQFSSEPDGRGVTGFMTYDEVELPTEPAVLVEPPAHFTTEPVALTGGSVDYYKFMVEDPTTAEAPYFIEVNDLIEAAGMNFAEGNIVKAIARIAGIRNGKGKPGVTGVYDAEKVVFFGDRVLKQQLRLAGI